MNLNDRYMEAYKHLDKICREMFSVENGVTTYIDTMEKSQAGVYSVPSWKTILQKLKEYRHIRNTYVHEVGTSDCDICTEEDIAWLESFYELIMRGEDPLAILRKQEEERNSVTDAKPYTVEDLAAYHPFHSNYSDSMDDMGKRKAALAITFTIFFVIAICAVVIVALLMCL